MSSTPRTSRVHRVTKETDIELELVLPDDGPVQSDIETPVPFLSHMLEALAKHAAMNLRVRATGDVHIDAHHTVEDVGLVLGQALDEALADRKAIRRFGHFSLAMDETLVDCAIDLGGRPYLVMELPSIAGRIVGTFDCDLVKEFFQALVVQGRMNLHLHQRAGGNVHHIVEASFKAFARSLRMACARDPSIGIPSTKGSV